MATEAALAVSNLFVRRGRSTILEDISFEVERGGPFAIAGPSGSGKTTLLGCIAGLTAPSAGTITIAGEALTNVPLEARARRVGLVFQDHQLFPHLTALGNVTLAPRVTRGEDVTSQAHSLFSELGLEGLEARRPHELSGGQRQRVAIARALVLRPGLLLFDEPTAALDPERTLELARLLRTLEARTQVLAVSHDAPFLEATCTRGIRLEAGRIAARGAVSTVLAARVPTGPG